MNSFRDAIRGGRLNSGPVMPAKNARRPQGAGNDLSAVPVPRVEGRQNNQRAEGREIGESSQKRLFVKRKHYVVDLLNLSGGGAMIRTNVPLKLWDCVHLELGDGARSECAVRWIKGDRIGLEFAHETQIAARAGELDAMLLDTIERSFPELCGQSGGNGDARKPFGAQRRSDLRHPLIWSGQILYEFETTPARLRNISEQGVMVECARDLPDGAEVMLDLGGAGQHFAVVSWAVGDQVGLRFRAPFDIACLSQAKPEVAPEHWSRPDYLNAAQDMDSPWAEPWRRLSLPELRDALEGYLKR